MAGKIVIRRTGSKIPTLLLLLIVMLCVVVGGLSVCGVPDGVLRYIEKRAEEQGIILRLETLKLMPTHGLAARATGIKIYAAAGEKEPLFTAQSAAAGLKLAHLLTGDLRLSMLQVQGGALQLHVTEPAAPHPAGQAAPHLRLSGIEISARVGHDNILQLSSGRANLQGISIVALGRFDLNALTTHRTSSAGKNTKKAPLNLRELISHYQSYIDLVYNTIESQHWEPDEMPGLAVGMDMAHHSRTGITLRIPRLDIDQFHFRRAELNLLTEDDLITINQLTFDTVDPEASALIKGSYNLRTRELGFLVKSNAALVRMAHTWSNEHVRKRLSKFSHPDDMAPDIELKGTIRFNREEDQDGNTLFTPSQIFVDGHVTQKQLSIGRTLVDEIKLSFNYTDGNFVIDQLLFRIAEKALKATAEAKGGKGSATISSDLPTQTVLTIIEEIAETKCALPQGMQLSENIRLDLTTDFTIPTLDSPPPPPQPKEQIDRPDTPSQQHDIQFDWRQFAPSLQKISLNLVTDELGYAGSSATRPHLHVNVDGIKQDANMLPLALGRVTATLTADQLTYTPKEGAPCTLTSPELELHPAKLIFGADAIPEVLEAIPGEDPKATPDGQKKNDNTVSFKAAHADLSPLAGFPLTITEPMLGVRVPRLPFNAAGIPDAIDRAKATFEAARADLTPLAGFPLTLTEPELTAEAPAEISIGTPTRPTQLPEGTISLSIAEAALQGEYATTLSRIKADAALLGTSIYPGTSDRRMHIHAAQSTVSIARIERDSVSIADLTVKLTDGRHINLGKAACIPQGVGLLCLEIGNLSRDAAEMDSTPEPARQQEDTQQPGKHAPPGSISAAIDSTNLRRIKVSDITAKIPPVALELLFRFLPKADDDNSTEQKNAAGDRLPEHPSWVEATQDIELSGMCVLNAITPGIQTATVTLTAPGLVRTPFKQKALRGKRVPISLTANGTLRTAKEDNHLIYDANVHITHEKNAMNLNLKSQEDGIVTITGENNILPDIIDQLIDSRDAHEIIRDFRFSKKSSVNITRINTTVNYLDGLRVTSHCDVDLRNSEYLMYSIVADGEGNESHATGIGPYALLPRITCGVDAYVVEVPVKKDEKKPEDKKDKDKKDKKKTEMIIGKVTITDPVLVYDNKPWLTLIQSKDGVRETTLRGKSIFIDIVEGYVQLNQLHGTIYPAYSLGMFYPVIRSYMKDVNLPLPAELQTSTCDFPIYLRSRRPMKGTVRVLAPRGASFHFLGTDIPLERFSGFLYLQDDFIQLDSMNARCWGGVLDSTVKIGITGARTSFDGVVTANCLDLADIAKAYKGVQNSALCSGLIRFRSPSLELKDLAAYGTIDIKNGDLMKLGFFASIYDLISFLPDHLARLGASATNSPTRDASSIQHVMTMGFNTIVDGAGWGIPGMNHLTSFNLQTAHANFVIANGHILSHGMKAKGTNLNIHINLDIDLNTLEMRGNLWPRMSNLPSYLLAPLSFISNYLISIKLYGTITHPKWTIGLDKELTGRKDTVPPAPMPAPEPRRKKK